MDDSYRLTQRGYTSTIRSKISRNSAEFGKSCRLICNFCQTETDWGGCERYFSENRPFFALHHVRSYFLGGLLRATIGCRSTDGRRPKEGCRQVHAERA